MDKDFPQKLDEAKKSLRLLSDLIHAEEKRNRVKELEFEMSDPDLWNNREVADKKIKELGELNNLAKRIDEIEGLVAESEISLSAEKLFSAKKLIVQLEKENLFTGKYDKLPALISIYSGAGGQDAEDWTHMLYEMYLKYCEKKGWKTKTIHETVGDFQSKTGRYPLKNVVFSVDGDYAYGYLKKESGVHRLVRISPFSPEKKRHTSFALVEILPDIEKSEKENIKIPEEDLKIEFSRSSGPGGQNVNKVETAVRIIHLPTGISAASQVERSQSRNRELAMNLLKAKLVKLMEDTEAKELNQLKTKVKPEW
ncbi:MAG: PCRF domain-containing protein, partial [Candidatus Wolfebacteria bacterium]|nr:PCRF domain-containing protein [Candidatus Wolfebacteria bacterium]